MHRLRLTHGPQAIPKLVRESTEQFFAKASASVVRKRKSTVQLRSKSEFGLPPEQRTLAPAAATTPTVAAAWQQRRQVSTEKLRLTTARSRSNLEVSRTILPPIERRASHDKPDGPLTSVSTLGYSTVLPPLNTSPSPSWSPTPAEESGRSEVAAIHSKPRSDADLFRRAYERALSVARSRRLIRDPYSLLGPRATNSVFYSYYDHTPMCVFSRGSACDHHDEKENSSTRDRRALSELARREIFDQIVVEDYLH